MGYKQKENPINMSEDHKMAYDRSEINRLKGDIHADDVNKHRGSWMSKHSKSALNYGSPLHAEKTPEEKLADAKEARKAPRKAVKDARKEVKAKKKEGRELRRKERTVKYGERQLKGKLADNKKAIDKESKELTVMPVDDGNMGNVTGKRSVTKNKTVTKKDGKRTVKKTKTVTK
jgi:hypothetical protein